MPRRLSTFMLAVAVVFVPAVPAGGLPRAAVSVDDAREAAEAVRAELNAAAARVEDARARFYEIENEIAELERRIDTGERDAEELRVVARRRAREAYKGASVSLDDAIESSDVLDAARKTVFLHTMKADDDEKLADLRALDEDLRIQGKELDTKRAEQERALDEMNAEITALESKAAAAEDVLAQAEEAERRERARREREAAERAAAAAARASRSRAEAAAPAPQPGPSGNLGGEPGGTFNMVCPFPGNSGFSDSWLDPRSGGRLHQGVDIPGPHGAPLVAAVSGSVSFGDMAGGGMGATLSGSDGNVYQYMHLSGYAQGGAVSQGDVIGYNGATGNANGFAHLHFEIHPGGGAAINPYPHVAAVC